MSPTTCKSQYFCKISSGSWGTITDQVGKHHVTQATIYPPNENTCYVIVTQCLTLNCPYVWLILSQPHVAYHRCDGFSLCVALFHMSTNTYILVKMASSIFFIHHTICQTNIQKLCEEHVRTYYNTPHWCCHFIMSHMQQFTKIEVTITISYFCLICNDSLTSIACICHDPMVYDPWICVPAVSR